MKNAAICPQCTSWSFRCIFRERLWVKNVQSIVKRAALLCLLLTLWSALASVTHHHANGAETASCKVCVAAHSAVPKATTNLLSVRFTPSLFIFRADPVSAKNRFVAFALSVRPPPTI